MYRAQVHRQVARNISSNGKVLECLVSGQGLGCSQILLENPVLIFRLAVRRRATGDVDPVSRHQRAVSGGQIGYYQELRVQCAGSGGPALWRSVPARSTIAKQISWSASTRDAR